ncbi:hypothetical protein SynSYN20_00835 [Synechococcus sp. SYN20]|uniref:hypothetical protein n=1 Tax=Synechococcus sp. SYN20 TaxID=1050714 RepID=UPI001648ABCA|nr:hypothetical protein [Synechococcus sp. SYN20]QNJ25177.1 hypothetical protein SynSYN20_00835 [Synechococcus sp. SYN20]
MTTAISAPALPTISVNTLSQQQLADLRVALLQSSDHAFDYLFEGLSDACREYASNLLSAQLNGACDPDTGLELEPTDEAIDSLSDDLFALVGLNVTVVGSEATA